MWVSLGGYCLAHRWFCLNSMLILMYCLHSFTAHILHSLWSLFLKFYWRVLKGILDVVLCHSSTSHPNPTKQEEQSSQFPFLLGPSHQVFRNAHVSESSRGTTLFMLDLYDKHSLLQTLLVIFFSCHLIFTWHSLFRSSQGTQFL